MRYLILIAVSANILCSQVLVSMDLLPSSGTSPEVGKGLNAFTWNIHACGIGASKPVPFDVVRMNFPEVRLYSNTQVSLILSQRVAKSLPVRIVNDLGFASAATGAGVTLDKTVNKSPSQLGTILTAVGLAIPAVTTLIVKQTPNYSIPNLPPNTITLSLNTCDDYTSLAPKGVAVVPLPSRRVDPLN
jgi:hypothetical protein